MKIPTFSALLGLMFVYSAEAQLDTVVFGSGTSEATHSIVVNSSGTATGALSQPCRYLAPILTGSTYGVNGGDVTVTMTVDPVRRNYFTLKLWGGDDNGEDLGRLYLYVPIGGVNYQVGYRHEGDYLPLSVGAWAPPLPGRFFYSTTLLPLWMTKGKTSLTFKIVATGELYGLGSGGPPGGNYQKVMNRNSRNLYRAYTHVDPAVSWAGGEPQGGIPATTVRPASGGSSESTMSSGGAFFNGVTNRINTLLNTTVSATTVYTTFTPADVGYLGRSYSVAGLVSFQNAAVANKVVTLLDAFAADYYATPAHAQNWGGNYGELGYGIHHLNAAGALSSGTLDALVNYSGTAGNKTRRAAWGDMLFASREYGRLSARRALTNQAFIASENIYTANRGLLVLGDPRAFSEEVAQRYLKDTCGLQPWLGNDAAGNNTGLPVNGTVAPYGSNYQQVTSKGLTREWGYVGAGYGEMAYHVIRWYRMNGNTEFRDQAVKMAKARAPFRRPAMQVSGTSHYRTMEVIGLLSWRGVHECDGNFDGYVGYVDAADVNEKGKGMTVAAATGDAALIGYAKQMLADNNYFNFLTGYSDVECLEAFADYQTVKNAADSGLRLPMTDGQPDFVWADEENRIVALKAGASRLWITPYWHAKGGSGLNGGTGINGVARFHFSAPTYDQYGTMETTPQFQANNVTVRSGHIDTPGGNFYVPPDNPGSAYAGEMLPQAITPGDASDAQPFGGKADFYAFRYGRYLIGLNAHSGRSYALKTPVGFVSGTNLVTGGVVSGSAVMVSATSTVVIDTGTDVDASPVPNAPLAVTAVGSSAPSVTLTWSESSGASTYSVRRSTTQGGPYTELEAGTDLTENTFTDSEVSSGAVYYYVVSASNANGVSYDSMEAAASAGVPAPWVDVDIGAVGTPGSSSLSNGVFTVNGYGSDLGGTTDSFHFIHVPMSGNGSITGRLASLYDQTGASKVGLMMRQNLTAGSPYVFTRVIGASMKVAWRSTNNGGTNLGVDYGTAVPEWYRITRNGNTFTIAYSADGNTWTTAGEAPVVSMSDPILVGMAVCSRNTGIPCQANFDSVVVSGVWETVPPAPAGLVAMPGSYSAGLSWTPSTGATTYTIRRALASGGPYTVVGATSGTTFSDTGLTNNFTYYYVVSAANSVGESVNSVEVAVTPVLTPPETPTSFSSLAGNGFVSLSWGASFGATGYNVKRATSSGGPFTTLVGSPVAGIAFTDSTVVNGTTYFYVVTAVGEGGESDATPVVSATPSAVPSVPVGLSAVTGNGQVALSWAPSLGAASYAVYRATSSSGPFTAITTGVTTTSHLNTGLSNGSTYYYRVSAVNAAGESAMSAAVSAVPAASFLPSPWSHRDIGSPGVAGGASYNNATFTVLASGSDIWGTSDQFHFVHQPTVLSSGSCEIIARVTSLTNVDAWSKAGLMVRKSLDANSAYAFVSVAPVSTSGVTFQYRSTAGGSAATAGSSTGSSRVPPEWLRLVVTGSTFTAYRSNSISLPSSWNTTLGPVAIPALSGSVFIGLAVTSHNNATNTTATFTNVTLALGTPAPPGNLAVSAGSGQAILSWNASPGATSYTIKRSVTNGGPYTTIASGVTSTSFTNTGLSSDTTYFYVVSASNATGEGGNSAQVAATTPAVPVGLSATAGGGQIALGWNAFTGATSYVVKRSTVSGGPYTTVALGVTGTTWQDTALESGQSYFYTIAAVQGSAWQTYDSVEKYATRDMPAPWLTQDVGTVSQTGTGRYFNGVISMAATGSDIGGTSDTFRIACIPLSGDGTITARLPSGNSIGKVGLMMRQNLTPGSPNVFVRVINTAMKLAWRSSTNGNTNLGVDYTPGIPQWYRLTRTGNSFTASFSSDGTNWTAAASGTSGSTTVTVAMSDPIYVGLGVCSRNSSTFLHSTFDNLSITGWSAPPFTPVGLTATGGDTQVGLNWSAAAGATGYNVRRSSISGGPYALIADNSAGTAHTDTGRTNGTTYYYVVSSLGAGGESTDSPQVAGTAMDAQQAWRLVHFGTMENVGNAADSADPDGDGQMNSVEFIAGTHPADPASVLKISTVTVAGNDMIVSFPTVLGKTYRAERSDTLQGGSWVEVQSGIPGTGGPVQITDAGGATQARRFYRVVVQ